MATHKRLDLFDRLLGTSNHAVSLQVGWSIQLQAEHPQKNIYRWYTIRVDKNLFGEWCLCLSYGRIGQRGQLKQSFRNDLTLLIRQLKSILRKRLNAANRIGCNYEIVRFAR